MISMRESSYDAIYRQAACYSLISIWKLRSAYSASIASLKVTISVFV